MTKIQYLFFSMFFLLPLSACSHSLLPPDKAFQVRIEEISPTELIFNFTMAPGYVLYKDRFSFIISGGNAQINNINYPPAFRKYDKAMNQEMDFYRSKVSINVSITATNGIHGTLISTAQGCALDEGVCYPPFKKAWSVGPININNLISKKIQR